MYVRVSGDDSSLKITTYHVTWLPSGNKTFAYLLAKNIVHHAILQTSRGPVPLLLHSVLMIQFASYTVPRGPFDACI